MLKTILIIQKILLKTKNTRVFFLLSKKLQNAEEENIKKTMVVYLRNAMYYNHAMYFQFRYEGYLLSNFY